MSSRPIPNISKRSDKETQLFFDTYYTSPINLSENNLNTVIAFFETKGFDSTAAITVSTILIRQAKESSIPVFELIDTLKGFDTFRLNGIVAEILNYNRKRTSVVGFKKQKQKSKFESRNIIENNPITTFFETIRTVDLSSSEITLDSETITLDEEQR